MERNDLNGFKAIASQLNAPDNTRRVSLTENWKQGRTAYGGLSLGLSYEAVLLDHKNLPPLRSAMINFIGPVSGDPVFATRLLRKGRNVTSTDVEAKVEDNIVATTTFVFGKARASEISVGLQAPDAPKPEACEPFTPKAVEPMVPKFFLNFDTRLIAGARPMSGAKEGYIRVWSRHKDVQSRRSVGSFLTLSDVLPPSASPLLKSMGPVSSVNFMLNILVDNPTTTDGWWQVETKLTAAHEGYSSQVMRFWNTKGVLVAEGMQSVAIFM